MKNSFKLAERQQQVKEVEGWVTLTPCLVCNKTIKDGYYGRFGNGGVCSKTCNTTYEKGGKHVHDEPAQRSHIRVGMASVPLLLSHVEP